MKRITGYIILISSLLSNSLALSQDVRNPYILYEDPSYFTSVPDYLPKVNIGNPLYVTTDLEDYILSNPAPYYNGEYEISMRQNYWINFENNTLPINQCSSPGVLCFSYKYELVSFPFVNECAYIQNACFQSQNRDLGMPDESAGHFTYNATDLGWYHNNNPTILMNNSGVNPFASCFYTGGTSGAFANSLISSGFISSLFNNPFRRAIPHSIIRHTVYAHCSYPPNASNIINQFSFDYDNTRGRMRYYPFFATNAVNSGMAYYDMIFYPMLIKNQNEIDFSGLGYDESVYDEHTVMPNGGINYYKHSEINPTATCASSTTYAIPTEIGSYFNQWTPNAVDPSFYYPCYSYLSAPLRSGVGNYIAGYELKNGKIESMPGIKQNYFIDQNTIIQNKINPLDKTIFNPSEVTLTATDFHFPQSYTFKTIRGIYPSVAEVNEDKIAANGYDPALCTTCDLRLIPVKTDLTTESTTDATNFPLSALPNTKHLYASRYYLDNVNNTFPKLTIENCVGLYDCTFDVKEGSTLEFTDYVAHYGTEDNSYTNTANRRLSRFKIQTLGGAVLRNLAPVQYLQNGNITQPAPLHYTATQDIFAGNNVDPDADINALSVNHDYTVQSGADVTLEANNTIYLKDGFSAMSGSTFTAKIATTPLASSGTCPDLSVNLRLAGTEKGSKKKTMQEGLQAYPNPTTGILKIVNNSRPVIAREITITDAFGRTVFEKINFNSLHDVIDFSTQPNGVYIAKVVNDGNSKPLRFVVNH